MAGADIREMSKMGKEESEDFATLGQLVDLKIEKAPLPVIALVDGFALGGGCELALACDFIYATEKARFGQPEAKLGLIPCFGGCVRLFRRIGPSMAKELIYTGRQIDAIEAKKLGLVNAVFKNEKEAMNAVCKTVQEIDAQSPFAIDLTKQIINRSIGRTIEEALFLEVECFGEVKDHRDSEVGISAFLEKRKAVFINQIEDKNSHWQNTLL